jgi:hypothetical protein
VQPDEASNRLTRRSATTIEPKIRAHKVQRDCAIKNFQDGIFPLAWRVKFGGLVLNETQTRLPQMSLLQKTFYP